MSRIQLATSNTFEPVSLFFQISHPMIGLLMASRMRSVQGAKGEIFSYIRIFMRACYTNPLPPFKPRGFFVQLTRYLGVVK